MSRGLSILFAQLLAGYFSYRIAFSIWLYTYDYLPIHAEFVNTPQCSLKYQVLSHFWWASSILSLWIADEFRIRDAIRDLWHIRDSFRYISTSEGVIEVPCSSFHVQSVLVCDIVRRRLGAWPTGRVDVVLWVCGSADAVFHPAVLGEFQSLLKLLTWRIFHDQKFLQPFPWIMIWFDYRISDLPHYRLAFRSSIR